MIWNILGLALTLLGLAWAIYGIWSSKQLKRHLLKDRDMIREKILDLRATQEKNRQIILNDRRTFNDPARNQVAVRIEELEANLDILDRFVKQLSELK
jgi:hypothetical protein